MAYYRDLKNPIFLLIRVHEGKETILKAIKDQAKACRVIAELKENNDIPHTCYRLDAYEFDEGV